MSWRSFEWQMPSILLYMPRQPGALPAFFRTEHDMNGELRPVEALKGNADAKPNAFLMG